MNGFIDTISTMNSGGTLAEVEQQLTDAVKRVRETGKKASITITLEICPASKGNVDVLAVTDKVTVKLPTAERGASIFYPQDDGTLSRRDNRQQTLPLRVVEPTEMPLKEAQA